MAQDEKMLVPETGWTVEQTVSQLEQEATREGLPASTVHRLNIAATTIRSLAAPAQPAPVPAADDDSAPDADALFKALQDQSWDLRCFSIPTGGDDYDIGWRVIGHWQAEPCARTIAEVFTDDPAEAVRQALVALKSTAAKEGGAP